LKARVNPGVPCAGPQCRGNIHGNKQETLFADFKNDSEAFSRFAGLEFVRLGPNVIKEDHVGRLEIVNPILPICSFKSYHT
jgi:hypothetical protein